MPTLETRDRPLPHAPGREGAREAATLVLVGNANVGKSVLFRNLTNRYVTVSNYPGTTVEIVRARADLGDRTVEVVDTPGINDLSPRSEDARVARDLLLESDDATILQVADAKNLRRALLLTLQLAELGRPMVLALNMHDELEERGGRIDVEALSEILGIPVVPTVAVRDRGTEELIEAIDEARIPRRFGRILEGNDEYARNRAALERVTDILESTWAIEQPRHASLRVRLGFWAMHPWKGLGVLGLVLGAVFWFVGLLGAGTLVDFFEVAIFQQRIGPLVIRFLDALLPFGHAHAVETVAHPIGLPVTPVHEWTVGTLSREVVVPGYELAANGAGAWWPSVSRFVHDLFVGEYGLITMGLSYAFAIVLPIVTTFFLAFSVLEDSGYFPRMAIMVNRLFRKMGLNGKAVLPMILGLGCDTMATMSTRILETRRERIVTTLLLALAVPCSAQLGVLLAMTTALSLPAAMLWVVVIVGVILFVGWLTARLWGASSSEFVLEVPPMRWPQASNVLVKTYGRLKWYLKEVVPLFLLGTFVLFVLDELDLLGRIADIGEPLVTGWLGLPSDMTNAFLVGFLRRDFGAVYILDAATGPNAVLSPHQIFVAMITITLFIPCFANLLIIAREHGVRVAVRMSAFIFPFAFLVGGTFHQLGAWLPIS
ncbi:MAG: ferrous iron transporter B [Gemmatimonadota bacterium]|nr:ferrous iron transporter B [Gemmatimonadota bacterium]